MRVYKKIHRHLAKQVFVLASKKRIKQLLASGDPIFLELGAGPRKGKNGWVIRPRIRAIIAA
jgi:hypothetical protein